MEPKDRTKSEKEAIRECYNKGDDLLIIRRNMYETEEEFDEALRQLKESQNKA